MQAADLPKVVAIEQRAFSHPWSLALYEDALNRYQCWVMEHAGEHVGHAVMQYIVDEAHLLNIVVAVEHQGRGYGQHLVNHVLQQAETQGSRECFLEVRASNHAAYALYERTGFNEIARRKNYYPTQTGHEDALLMVCPVITDWADV